MLNLPAQSSDAWPPSSVMMDGVISILGFTQNLKPKHMVGQMFQQGALFELPCSCPLTLDLRGRILMYSSRQDPFQPSSIPRL